MLNASITKTTPEWNTINWAKVPRKVFKLQTRIFQAVKSGNNIRKTRILDVPNQGLCPIPPCRNGNKETSTG